MWLVWIVVKLKFAYVIMSYHNSVKQLYCSSLGLLLRLLIRPLIDFVSFVSMDCCLAVTLNVSQKSLHNISVFISEYAIFGS